MLFPVLDGFLVPLIRSALWFLQALPQGFEQTTHMSRMIADSKLPSDHYWDSPASTDTFTLRDVSFSYSILLEVGGAHVTQR